MYVKFSTLLYSCVPTLPCKLPHAKHIKCNAFSSVDCGWLWKEPVVYNRCSKWCPFALQSCCPLINGLVDDALRNVTVTPFFYYLDDCDATVTWKTRHFRHFTSEQNKVSKSKVVEKRILNVCRWHVPQIILKKLLDVCLSYSQSNLGLVWDIV